MSDVISDVIEDPDEPLEGDIGPAASAVRRAGASGRADTAEEPGRAEAAEELRRYEAAREDRRRSVNAVSGRITVILAAGFLAFLTYDSAHTAVAAHRRGGDWLYPPAVMAGICSVALVSLLALAVRLKRRNRGR